MAQVNQFPGHARWCNDTQVRHLNLFSIYICRKEARKLVHVSYSLVDSNLSRPPV